MYIVNLCHKSTNVPHIPAPSASQQIHTILICWYSLAVSYSVVVNVLLVDD